MTGELPAGWASAPLAALGTWLGGGTPSKAVAEFWTDGTIPWVSPKDMKRLVIDSAQDRITERALASSATNLVPARSVLMVTRSGILEHTFPVAVNAVPVTINQDLKAWTPTSVDSLYAAYYLRARQQDVLRDCSKDGTTVSSIDFDQLAKFPMLVPPLAEQQRIVSRIEELFSEIDEGERALERVGQLVERYRQSVLKAAVTGELTRDWRDGRKPDKPADSKDCSGMPYGWRRATGQDLFKWASGDFLPAKKMIPGPVPVYGGNGVNGSHAQSNVDQPTVVIGRVGVHCGNVHMTTGAAWITDNAIYARRWPTEHNLRFLALVLRSARLGTLSQGGAQPFVNQKVLNETVFGLPCREEQDRLVDAFEVESARLDAVESSLVQQRNTATALRQSILKAAFSGQLVPQDPNDEPASALLARLAAQAAEAPAEPKRRGRKPAQPAPA